MQDSACLFSLKQFFGLSLSLTTFTFVKSPVKFFIHCLSISFGLLPMVCIQI